MKIFLEAGYMSWRTERRQTCIYRKMIYGKSKENGKL